MVEHALKKEVTERRSDAEVDDLAATLHHSGTPKLRSKNSIFRWAAILALAAATGCGKPSASSVAASHSQLFTTDPLKSDWETATAAMQTNGYLTAERALNKMQTENPNAQQLQAISDTLRTLNDQMIAAAAKGDVNAGNALEEMKKMYR